MPASPSPSASSRLSPWPVTLTLLVWAGLLAYNGILTQGQWVLALLPGRAFAPEDVPTLPSNPQGYDGQFGLYMTMYPPPQVAAYLDVPAYRYQRVLLPALAGLLSRGRMALYPWAAWFVLALGHALGVRVVQGWLRSWGRSPWWALLYGLWPGLGLAFRVGLPEPLSYGLALAGLDAGLRGRTARAAALLLAAVLAKETALLIVAALTLAWLPRQPRRALALTLGVVVPWLLWQAVLWALFGQVGVRSGGAGATAWPWIPLGWLLEIARHSLHFAVGYLALYGPGLLAPLAVGLRDFAREIRAWARRGWRDAPDVWAWLLGVHGLVALWLPTSTWAEPFAAIRVLTGFLLAFWLYGWQRSRLKAWRFFLPFWMLGWILALARV